MNVREVINFVRDAAIESAELQIEDYIDNGNDFVIMQESDEVLISIMKNKSIRDKEGAFADFLVDDEEFLYDHIAGKVYSIESNKDRGELLKELYEDSKQQSWVNVLQKIEKELQNA